MTKREAAFIVDLADSFTIGPRFFPWTASTLHHFCIHYKIAR